MASEETSHEAQVDAVGPWRGAWIRSKVAWRLVLLFVLCAVVPTTVVAVVGYRQLEIELRDEGEARLRGTGTSIAGELVARLDELRGELDRLDERLALQGDLWPRSLILDVGRSFREVTYRSEDETHFLLGRAVDLPVLPHTDEAHIRERLRAGTTFVHLEYPDAGPPNLLLAYAGERGVWTARVRDGSLVPPWDEEARSGATEFCALDGRGRAIGCSSPGLAPLVAAARDLADHGPATPVVHDADGVAFLARAVPLSIEPRYAELGAASTWEVLTFIPEAEILGPLEAFRSTFTLLASLTIAFASLLSLTQIRRQLVPLEALRRGTQRLAEGDFGVNLDIHSGDDFEDLADSFNQMTRRLHTQFDSLQRLVEIDRSILSEITVARVLETMVESVGELYLARVAIAIAADADGVESTAAEPAAPLVRERHDALRATDLERWFPGNEPRPLDPAAEDTALRPVLAALLARHPAQVWTALPLRLHAHLVAVLLLGSDREATPDEALFARKLTSQCAVALANARTLERNRVLAYYDTLTSLPNRLLFRERLNQALRRARRQGHALGVILLDLDDFKRVNDTLGPAAGDRLLCGVADRLQHEAGRATRGQRVAVTIARSGGDEFMVLLEELDGIGAAARFADRLRKAVAQPDSVDDHDVTLSASAGIAMCPEDGQDLETLLRNASTALHHAKDRGRDRYEFFTSSMTESAANRLAIEAGLRRALERDELRVYYQPIVDIDDRSPIGMEALVRWQHPERGVVLPGEFVGIAEATGLIPRIGEFVLRRACADTARLQRDHGVALRLALNASPIQLRERDWVPIILSILGENGLSPSGLALEITEGVVAEANPHLLRQLAALGQAGVQIAIDDFGTGYSSLAYLKQFPVDVLKIDRSFTAGMVDHAEDRAIVHSVIAMAQGLGLRTVAEGVEREDQLAMLRQLRCQCAQGNLFGSAMPADEFSKWLRERWDLDNDPL